MVSLAERVGSLEGSHKQLRKQMEEMQVELKKDIEKRVANISGQLAFMRSRWEEDGRGKKGNGQEGTKESGYTLHSEVSLGVETSSREVGGAAPLTCCGREFASGEQQFLVSQRQIVVVDSNKYYNLQYSDRDKSIEQLSSSCITELELFHNTRQSEANFLAMDTDSNQRNLVNSRGLSIHELEQRSGLDHQAKSSVRFEACVSPVSYGLFGGQQRMSHHHPSMLQSLQHQQSGFNDMQQLQQEVMLRKMQELQMQQQLRQLGSRQQNLLNQNFPYPKQASGHHSSPWVADNGNSNGLHHGSPTMQESLNASPLNLGQARRSGDLVPQLADQSLYGVPISGSRGLTVNQYSQMAMDRPSMLQTSAFSNSLPGIQLADQVSMHDGTTISRHRFQNENILGNVSCQALNAGINMESVQQVNLIQRDAPQQGFRGRQNQSISQELSHEKPTRQYSSSQNEVALDPTEEKILFGSDDNIWAAFGKSPNISGEVGSLFDNGGLLNGIPSIQSGSWSALMQSAVAETSSSDIGPQEEWSGLVNSTSANQHRLPYNVSGKQDESLADNNMQMPSAFTSGSAPHSDDSRMNNNYQNAMGFDQFVHEFQGKPGQTLQSEMSQRHVQSLEEANQWSNCGPLQRSVAEGSQLYKNVSPHSLDAEKNSKCTSTLWNSEHSGRKQTTNRTALGPVKHSMENEGGLGLNDAGSIPNSSATGVDEENSQFVQNGNLLNQWKNTNPLVKSRRGESFGSMLHSTNEGDQVSDSTHGSDREEVATHEMDSSDLKGNSNESFPTLLQHIPSGLRDSGLSDASDSEPLPTGKQKSTNQLGRKASGPRKFQYHPMGNLDEDVESAHGMKQRTHALAMSQQNVHLGGSKSFNQVPMKSMRQSPDLQRDNKGLEGGPSQGSLPGYTPNISVPFNRSVDSCTPNKTSSSQNMLELLHKVDQPVNLGPMMHFNSSEQNSSSKLSETENCDSSVDRLHRNNSSASQGFRLQLGPPSQLMQISEHSPTSQTAQHTNDSPHSSHAAAEIGEKGLLKVTTSSIQSAPFSNEQSKTRFKNEKSGIPCQSESGSTLYKIPGNFSSTLNSGSGHSISPFHHQQMTRASGQMSANQHINSSFDRSASHSTQEGSKETFLLDASCSTSHDNHVSSGGTSWQNSTNDPQARGSTDTMSARDHVPPSQPLGPHGASAQMFMWTNVPTHQQTLRAQFHKVSAHFPESPHPNIVESSSSVPHTVDDHYVKKGENLPSEHSGIPMNSAVVSGEGLRLKESAEWLITSVNTDLVQKMNESHEKVSSVKYPLDDCPANSSSTQKDIEVFGRLLKPNSFSHENYSLLNQVQAMKDAETDPNIRVSKRMRGPDSGPGVQQVALEGGQVNEHSIINGDSLGSNAAAVSSGDSRMQIFSRSADILEKNVTSQHGNVASQDVLTFGRNTFQRISLGPQMAPSWFDHYGTSENGRILPMYDASTVTTLRTVEPPFTLGKSSSSLHTSNSMGGTSLVGGAQQSSIPSSVATEHFSSPESLHMVILETKKRKDATSERHPWHKEVSQGLQNLKTIRMAEVNWCKAANRLTDKVEDIDLIEDGLQVLRSKRRLILTTQLMQQLICPPPVAILSSDASSDYESVPYSVSRIALGEACSAVSHSSDSDMPCGGEDVLSTKGKQSERISGCLFGKAITEFMGRAMKLENEFLRLDKSASILDLRVECQDLEKFSVINRFAKFHGRGQSDSAETASTSDVSSSIHKPFLQRYVTALPMPRSIPDRVQCLSL
ncbi:unnamed protein product [Fraxinus pennsylvanica]|uniref:Uncharacterized protein n=1 Tax=Fraxinus pennsylvanica TaxID=56036 RepID=A0AAD2DJP4_9LAMI|nr:unnamed protein product [Fraxinus pennsylvanica]